MFLQSRDGSAPREGPCLSVAPPGPQPVCFIRGLRLLRVGPSSAVGRLTQDVYSLSKSKTLTTGDGLRIIDRKSGASALLGAPLARHCDVAFEIERVGTLVSYGSEWLRSFVLCAKTFRHRKKKVRGFATAFFFLDQIKREKGVWWMPWQSEAMKDVVHCDKLWGAVNRL